MSNAIRHILITRYNVANLRSPVDHFFMHVDALDPDRLAIRFRIFEMATFPAVAAQTEQDFDWVILIDPQLPQSDRAKLEGLTSKRPRTHLVTYVEGQALWRTEWLSPWLEPDGALATTNLDDDDALPRTYMASLKRLTHAELSGSESPGIRVFGFIAPRQWDLRFTAQTPLGTHSPWHRSLAGKAYASSCGLTALTPNLKYNLSVLGLSHTGAIRVLDPTEQFEKWFHINMQRLVRACAEAAGDDWTQWSPETHFIPLDDKIPLPVMLNHGFNEQRGRLEEAKPDTQAVTGPESIPHSDIDWECVARYAKFIESTRGD